VTFLRTGTLGSASETFLRTGTLGSASVTFLRTGHTHEDIDQMFSALAGYLAVQLGLLAFRHSGTCAPISLIPPVGNHAVPQSARSLVL